MVAICFRAMPPTGSFDVVVIGSGFGGSVTACRLAESGAKVLILERGRRWDRTTYPRLPGDPWIWNQSRPHKKNGWLDFRLQRGASVAQGAGVGGGSLIYANIQLIPPRSAFDDGWPAEITFDGLAPYYARVTEMLRPAVLPESQWPQRLKTLRDAAEKMGHGARFSALPMAVTFDPAWSPDAPGAFTAEASRTWVNPHGKTQGTCVHCGNCYIGCRVDARNTLDMNYLARAEAHGAEIRPLHLVRCITPVAEGYRVDFDRIEHGRLQPGSVTAPRVVVAAGSLGSTELLLRCRDQFRTLPRLSPALGQRWSANGDLMSISVQQTPVRPTQGPTITGAIDFLDGSLDGARMLIEDGGFPDIFRGFVQDGMKFELKNLGFYVGVYGLAIFLRRQGGFEHLMPWFGQSVDAADGRLRLTRRWLTPWRRRLTIDYRARASRPTIDRVYRMHQDLTNATGGRLLPPFAWTVFRTLITPHPLGGCRMAATPDAGVVNHAGAVFGYPNLFVADGAIVPKALGLNPSKTIAALAERIADGLRHG
jgi:cholesterol oxidase